MPKNKRGQRNMLYEFRFPLTLFVLGLIIQIGGFVLPRSNLDLGIEIGLVQKSGAWYGYQDLRLVQGRENAREFLRSNPDLSQELDTKIRQHFTAGAVVTVGGPSGESATE